MNYWAELDGAFCIDIFSPLSIAFIDFIVFRLNLFLLWEGFSVFSASSPLNCISFEIQSYCAFVSSFFQFSSRQSNSITSFVLYQPIPTPHNICAFKLKWYFFSKYFNNLFFAESLHYENVVLKWMFVWLFKLHITQNSNTSHK